MIKVLQRRQGISSGGLSIMELNDFFDYLASGENRYLTTDLITDELVMFSINYDTFNQLRSWFGYLAIS